MDIEEYRPAPPRCLPPEPPRKDHSALIMSLILVGTFVGTLAFEGRHELAEYARSHLARSLEPKTVQLSQARNTSPQNPAEQKLQGNLERAMACMPVNVLSADDIDQLSAAIAVLSTTSTGTASTILTSDSFDPQKMTPEQGRELLQILAQVSGPVGDKALQALNRSISEGPCKIHADIASFAPPETQQSKPAPSPFL